MRKLNVEKLKAKFEAELNLDKDNTEIMFPLTRWVYLQYEGNEEQYKYILCTTFDGDVLDYFETFEEAVEYAPILDAQLEEQRKK